VRIKHEEIPGYMAAMTMSFEARDTNELAGLEAGDHVAFRMLVTDDDGWIDQLRKLPRPDACEFRNEGMPYHDSSAALTVYWVNDGHSIRNTGAKNTVRHECKCKRNAPNAN
jgi:hypothetical protein